MPNPTNGNDTLKGNSGNDVINGRLGDDTLLGFGGDDKLKGAGGDDLLRGGAGADTLRGDAGADTLQGGTGNDSLLGGTGDDILTGGKGDDILRGGEGADTFIFGKQFGNDIVLDVDFSEGDRLIFTADFINSVFVLETPVTENIEINENGINPRGINLDFNSDPDIGFRADGNDAIFNFGNGNIITFQNLDDVSFLDGLA